MLDKKEVSPRILVVSNNSFSKTTNNGKTLASFFKKFPSENIAQLYFNPEIPTESHYINYFRITDKDIINGILKRREIGKKITIFKDSKIKSEKKKNKRIPLKKLELARIFREVLWSTNIWKTENLNIWLDEFQPEVLFFCAGDSGFAYDIAKHIKERYGTKLIVYITDDYILPRRRINLFWWLRRNLILKKMDKSIDQSDLFITISKEMSKVYKQIFGKDSIVAANMSESMKMPLNMTINQESSRIEFIYAGGIHYNRYKTLEMLGKTIEKYNLKKDVSAKEAILKIYTGNIPNEKILSKINIEGSSQYCGSLNKEELKVALNKADILVHVESFDRKCIESTRLSVSTKIPEYLSIEKPILAIGPEEVASMKYLYDAALCITDPDDLYEDIKALLEDNDIKVRLENKAKIKYQSCYMSSDPLIELTESIQKLYYE